MDVSCVLNVSLNSTTSTTLYYFQLATPQTLTEKLFSTAGIFPELFLSSCFPNLWVSAWLSVNHMAPQKMLLI